MDIIFGSNNSITIFRIVFLEAQVKLIALTHRTACTSGGLAFFIYEKAIFVSLLGLLAKIKCSICSYQFNIWYGVHSAPCILI